MLELSPYFPGCTFRLFPATDYIFKLIVRKEKVDDWYEGSVEFNDEGDLREALPEFSDLVQSQLLERGM